MYFYFVRLESLEIAKVIFECYVEWCGSLSLQHPLTTPGSRHVNNHNHHHHHHYYHQPAQYGRNEEPRRAAGITHRISHFILMVRIFPETVQSSTKRFTVFYMMGDLGMYYTCPSN
jgi:hypothetical protein